MKVKALIKFKDVKANKIRDKGSVFEVTKERIQELNSTSWGTIVEEVPTKEEKNNG